MKQLTVFGLVLSTATLISMSVVGVNAYNTDISMEPLEDKTSSTVIVVSSPNIIYDPEAIDTAVEQIAIYQEQRECLAINIYHEAMGESELGQRAVAYATINRTKDPRYASTICEVVHQAVLDKKGNPVRNKCQYSWYCDGKSDKIEDEEAYARALVVATIVINTYGNSFDPTMGATMYHTDEVKPKWRKSFDKTTEIENHIFYKL
jgi:spore germination cell wall hydrolase CwlJ-like protein